MIGGKQLDGWDHKPLQIFKAGRLGFGSPIAEGTSGLSGNEVSQIDLSIGDDLTTTVDGTDWRTAIDV